MVNFKIEINKIFGNNVGLENWTADAGHDDFWCPSEEDIEKVKKVHKLIKNNLKKALVSEYPYIKMFAQMIKDPNQKFMAGHETFNKYFPEMAFKNYNNDKTHF